MITVTILIVFAISSYCQGHPHSRNQAINSNSNIRIESEEYQGNEWIAELESENEVKGVTDVTKPFMRPDNGEGYIQTWKQQTKTYHYNEDNSDPIAHVEAPPVKKTPVPNAKPYTAIGRLRTALCTGTFVARKAILTAAHCVYENGKYINPGKFQRQKDCNLCAQEYTPDKLFVPPDYEKDENRADLDYAIIITKEASTEWLNYAAGSTKKMNLVVYGYPDADPKKCMWESTCQLFRNGAKILYYPCQSKPGMSGGPVYDPIKKVIVGIHSAGDNGNPPIAVNDSGVRITDTVRDTITDWITKNGGN